MTDLREAVARLIAPIDWSAFDDLGAKMKYSGLSVEPSLAKAEAILALLSQPTGESVAIFSHCHACAKNEDGQDDWDAGVGCSSTGPTEGCEAVWITSQNTPADALARATRAEAERDAATARAERAEGALTDASMILAALTDESLCYLDQNGACHSHAHFGDGECPAAISKRFLTALAPTQAEEPRP